MFKCLNVKIILRYFSCNGRISYNGKLRGKLVKRCQQAKLSIYLSIFLDYLSTVLASGLFYAHSKLYQKFDFKHCIFVPYKKTLKLQKMVQRITLTEPNQ